MKKRMLSLFLTLVMCMGLCTIAHAGGREAVLKYLDDEGNTKTVRIDLDWEEDENAVGPNGMWRSDGFGNLTLNNFEGISVTMDGGDGLILQGSSSIQKLTLRAYYDFDITVSGRGSLEINNPNGKAALTMQGFDGADIRFQGLQVSGAQDGAAVTLPTVSDTLASATYADGSDATHILIAPASQPPKPEFSGWKWELNDGRFTLVSTGADFKEERQRPWAEKCAEATEIVIGEKVSIIGVYCFSGFSNVKSVTIPDTVKLINQEAFKNSGLESVIIPAGTKVGHFAFAGCPNLTWIYLPSLENAEQAWQAFLECKNLKDVYFGGSEDQETRLLELTGGFGLQDSVTIHYNAALADLPTAPSPGPDQPDTPIEPDKPVTPPEPDKPVTPPDPDEPETPPEPDHPTVPDTPDVPVTPPPAAAPVVPVVPVTPTAPAAPSAKPDAPSKSEDGGESAGSPAESAPPAGTEAPAGTPAQPAPVYTDVPADAWYSEAAAYVSSKGLMTGTSAGLFSPEAHMTRAMLWTVLSRLDGAAVSSGEEWYTGAQAWSVARGISDGMDPNGNITREQLVTMLWRFNGSPSSSDALTQFTDSASVSSYASSAVSWAVSGGLLKGDTGALNPQGTATRAEVAAILQRFCQTFA